MENRRAFEQVIKKNDSSIALEIVGVVELLFHMRQKKIELKGTESFRDYQCYF